MTDRNERIAKLEASATDYIYEAVETEGCLREYTGNFMICKAYPERHDPKDPVWHHPDTRDVLFLVQMPEAMAVIRELVTENEKLKKNGKQLMHEVNYLSNRIIDIKEGEE